MSESLISESLILFDFEITGALTPGVGKIHMKDSRGNGRPRARIKDQIFA